MSCRGAESHSIRQTWSQPSRMVFDIFSLTCLVLFTRRSTILSKLCKDPQSGGLLFLIGLVWLYPVIRPIARPTVTQPYDMFTIQLLFLGSSILQIGGLLRDCTVFSTSYPPPFTIFALSTQTSLQSSDCYISYLACLSQLPTTSSVRLRSCVSPSTPLTMANFRQGRSATLEDCTSL